MRHDAYFTRINVWPITIFTLIKFGILRGPVCEPFFHIDGSAGRENLAGRFGRILQAFFDTFKFLVIAN